MEMSLAYIFVETWAKFIPMPKVFFVRSHIKSGALAGGIGVSHLSDTGCNPASACILFPLTDFEG